MEEIWKDVTESKAYQASNLGNVRSKSFTIIRSNGRPYTVKSRILKPARGQVNSRAKIDNIKALTIIACIKAGLPLIKISKELNVSYNIVKDINRGKTWNFLKH